MYTDPPEHKASTTKKLIRRTATVLGCAGIVVLMYFFCSTLDEHMAKSQETRRDAQWKLHAPIESAKAAAAMEGMEPHALTRPSR